ncbi:hypothetical protein [Bacillus cereus]|uniref:AbiTii domain-containing protein n=1 Tax=Bacillus cereus TaxID=1396 RepID=UPI000BF4091A|nr:hypothetical protein [Bacillus cereus]MCQ6305033.1 hypothetical protein [Bacillus cereus]PEV07300.1 hypothetical protein CN407_17290 [Bacillus cereus]PGM64363.1 hypothetical protein CN950_18650 [Bacillus cereus]
MEAIVLDLQKEAYDSKSNVVARKLKLEEFGNWVNEELNGYQSYEKTPEYRNVCGQLKARDLYGGGLIPVLINDPKYADIITNRKLVQPISEIESYVGKKGNILVTFPVGQREILSKAIGTETEYFLEVSKNQIGSIVDNVRNIVLEWSLKLEEEGILGEGMSFSKEEKEKAKNQGPLISFGSDASGVQIQIQQNTSNSSQTMQQGSVDLNKVEELLQTIKDNINNPDLVLSTEQSIEISESIKIIEAQKQLGNPDPNLIKEGFRTIRNVLEGITGSITASGIIHHLGLFLN